MKTPDIRVVGDRVYELQRDYQVRWVLDYRQHCLIIPAGFRCDGNSVPWFGRPLVPGDWSLGLVPVLAHDWLYHVQGRLYPHEYSLEYAPGIWGDPLDRLDGTRTAWTRKDADRLFARLMRDAGVPKWRRRAAYRAVRLARWHDWDESPWRLDDPHAP